jgi:hypothetical protein
MQRAEKSRHTYTHKDSKAGAFKQKTERQERQADFHKDSEADREPDRQINRKIEKIERPLKSDRQADR